MPDKCRKCGRTIEGGELVTGQDWAGEGGSHVTCPSETVYSRADGWQPEWDGALQRQRETFAGCYRVDGDE